MYGEAGNELLSDRAAIVWMTLPDDVRIREVSSLISELEQSATLMAEFISEKQKRIEYNNWGELLRLYSTHIFFKIWVYMNL
uniref:Bm12484 n=2 Tax=Brugia TaxID=6278 RepID=A0A1I9GDF4_BRUMA|nr:Bm12484 [Brugia malayi]